MRSRYPPIVSLRASPNLFWRANAGIQHLLEKHIVERASREIQARFYHSDTGMCIGQQTPTNFIFPYFMVIVTF
jgi:hypothetical protein